MDSRWENFTHGELFRIGDSLGAFLPIDSQQRTGLTNRLIRDDLANRLIDEISSAMRKLEE